MGFPRFAVALMRCVLLTILGLAAAPAAAAEVDYLRDVKPTLRAHCFSFHGAARQQAGLRPAASPLLREGGRPGRPPRTAEPARRHGRPPAACLSRSDRPAADAGRAARLPRRRNARRLREGGRASPGAAALRRTLGPRLARRLALQRPVRP